jgi:Uma2 family endonuclease
MAAIPHPQYWTVEAYLAFEATSEIKHEYYAGEMIAMSGASPNHDYIKGSTFAQLFNQLRKRPCSVFTNDIRVQVSKIQYVYPDVTVVCGTPSFNDNNPPSLLNPTVLIEVLSPSTQDYDRGVKAEGYRALAGLKEFLLIAQKRCHIAHYVRHSDQQWLVTDVTHLDAVIELQSLQCTLSVAEVYEKVTFGDDALS